MRRIVVSKIFLRQYNRALRKHPAIAADLETILPRLAANPFEPGLCTHKLKGRLAGLWSCTLGYDLRLVFDFVPAGRGNPDSILLVDIGTHDDVY